MISVIMPAYNRGKTIKRAIDSVLNQTYQDIELIIIDDCSTDNTKDVIDLYDDDRLHYIKLEKNSGACYARNVGIENAKGDYIAFQDSDDSWYLDKLEKQLINMNENGSDLDFCYFERITDNDVQLFPNKVTKKNIKKYGITKALRYGNFISTQLILGKKECFLNFSFDNDLPRLQDFDLILRISEKYKISCTPEILASVYVQDDSISKSNEKFFKAVDLMLNKKYLYQNILSASLYRDMAKMSLAENKKKDARKYYLKSLKMHFGLKNFIKYIFTFIR